MSPGSAFFVLLLFVLFVGGIRDQNFRIVDLELDNVLLGDPVRTVLKLEGPQDFSGVVLSDLDQTGRSRPAAVPELESDQTGTEADDNALNRDSQVYSHEIPPHKMARILCPSAATKMTGLYPPSRSPAFRTVLRYYNIIFVFVNSFSRHNVVYQYIMSILLFLPFTSGIITPDTS